MGGGNRVCASSVAAFLVLLLSAPASAPAQAPSKPITGKLSKPGYTVIALAPSGEARAVLARRGRFRLRPPGPAKSTAGSTLQLRGPDGTYAGPIVIAREKKGKRAILGVRPGAKLGKVRIASGYAMLRKRLAQKLVDVSLSARAKKGVPIGAASGAGKAGLVRSKHTKGGAPGDSDLDGVPDTLDIDDDGDLILDDYDRSTHRRVSQTASSSQAEDIGLPFASFAVSTDLNPGGAVNVNGGSSDEQIAAAQQNGGRLNVLWEGIDPGSGELDCGTLVYCSAGGTGRFQSGTEPQPRNAAPPFPECCDPDGDGFGSLTNSLFDAGGGVLGGVLHMVLYHGATADQIRAGDVLIERATIHGATQQFASSVGFVFSTQPALATYTDGQGNSATFSYPRAATTCLPVQVFEPFPSCSSPVRAGPNGDVVVTLTFWRPQRQRVEGEPGEGKWMDVGNLVYAATVTPASDPGALPSFCPASSYSAVDPNLTLLSPSEAAHALSHLDGAGFADLVGDQPSNPANTFTYTLNLSDCLASQGRSVSSSEAINTVVFGISANDGRGSIFMATSSAQFLLQP